MSRTAHKNRNRAPSSKGLRGLGQVSRTPTYLPQLQITPKHYLTEKSPRQIAHRKRDPEERKHGHGCVADVVAGQDHLPVGPHVVRQTGRLGNDVAGAEARGQDQVAASPHPLGAELRAEPVDLRKREDGMSLKVPHIAERVQ
jgi:hypothetical protein